MNFHKELLHHFVFGGGRGLNFRFSPRLEVPRPALLWEEKGEVVNPARRSPGGRRMEPTAHLETIAFIAFILIFGFHHFAVTSTIRSCGQKPYTGGWQQSENGSWELKWKWKFCLCCQFFLCSFLYLCWRVLSSVLDKESLDLKVLAVWINQIQINAFCLQ